MARALPLHCGTRRRACAPPCRPASSLCPLRKTWEQQRVLLPRSLNYGKPKKSATQQNAPDNASTRTEIVQRRTRSCSGCCRCSFPSPSSKTEKTKYDENFIEKTRSGELAAAAGVVHAAARVRYLLHKLWRFAEVLFLSLSLCVCLCWWGEGSGTWGAGRGLGWGSGNQA